MKLLRTQAATTVLGLLFSAPLIAQTELVRDDYFPAELEFKELQKTQWEKTLKHPAPFADSGEQELFDEAGYVRYAARGYSTKGGSAMTVEVLTTKDLRAAYSLLTLVGKTDLRAGPPGEYFSSDGTTLVFAKGPFWVRVQGDNPDDLLRRVAQSVSNRIGPREAAESLLPSHLPRRGMEASSVRFFLGPRAFKKQATAISGSFLKFQPDMEIAQARYSLENQAGVLSLLSFPTSQLAEEYFDGLDAATVSQRETHVFAKKVGPLVGVLEGNFDPSSASALLGSIRFSYSIKWIYDKNARSSSTVWGVPVGLLGTVVRSLVLTVLLCGVSLLAGIGMGAFRLALRTYAPRNFLDRPERTEMIRLNLDQDHPKSELPDSGRPVRESEPGRTAL
jgi:hypothetical protein